MLRFKPIELDPVLRRLGKAANVSDLRRIAKRRLPGGVFDYIDGGAEDEIALSGNSAAYRRWRFEPRVLRDVSNIDTSSMVLGRPVSMPLVLAPTGFTGIADPQGELAVARAAQRAELPYNLSTLGTRSIEEVAAVSDQLKSVLERNRRRGRCLILVRSQGDRRRSLTFTLGARPAPKLQIGTAALPDLAILA